MYAKPDPKKLAAKQREQEITREIEACYRQHRPRQVRFAKQMQASLGARS